MTKHRTRIDKTVRGIFIVFGIIVAIVTLIITGIVYYLVN